MNKIFDKIDEITVDKKQAHQVRALIKEAFAIGIAFAKNMPYMDPTHEHFDRWYNLYLLSIDREVVELFNEEMKDYEKGNPTELG